MHNLSDEVLCARWIENPYYQYFCGELSFRHRLPFDRSSMTRWRQRLGEEQLVALIQESLSVAHKTGALGPKDLERVVVDTTVQPKAVAHPTDARLLHRAIIKLVGLAKRNRVPLRQSYLRLAKRAAIMTGRYTHAHQFKRARRQLKFVVVDTTVQPKAVAHPTDARLLHRAIIKLVGLAKRNRVPLRQSYLRLAKRAAIMTGRYTHAHQFKRARRQLKFLRTRLGRIIRDIRRKIDGDTVLEARFGPLLGLAQQVRSQDQHQRGPKVYALHAPEVECIGKGKARAPYEFGCKVSIATPVTSPKGGQFVVHAKALHGNPFDGHTLGPVIADMEKLTGVEARGIHVDKGYRGHNHPHRFRVWISGQVRRVTASIRREMKRRAAVEPVIGHVKAEHRMDRNYLKGRLGDRINAVLAAAGYNFGLLLRWLAELLRVIIRAFFETLPARNTA
ncbi:hypothetical protein ACVIHI_008067 [Bradyrhizobium sp. USDA 4524]